jgi:hypothetical protein
MFQRPKTDVKIHNPLKKHLQIPVDSRPDYRRDYQDLGRREQQKKRAITANLDRAVHAGAAGGLRRSRGWLKIK